MRKHTRKSVLVKVPKNSYRVFGLRNELVHHLLTPHYFCLVCGME
jgi:hypothetical protein